MLTYFKLFLSVAFCLMSLQAFSQLINVTDQSAQSKTIANILINTEKYQKIQDIRTAYGDLAWNYSEIHALQQKIITNLKQTTTVQDLLWSDLSKAAYLAEELLHGAREPGLEIDFGSDHPILEADPEQIYHALFIADHASDLPKEYVQLDEALQQAYDLQKSFHLVSVQRKAYAAVAYQYLSEDLVEKSMELQHALKQPDHFSMTEADRLLLLQSCEDYLLQAAALLINSDQYLLQLGQDPVLERASNQKYHLLERAALGKTKLPGHP